MITLRATDGHTFTAARADPTGAPRGGIVILHAVYGLTPHLSDVCAAFARHGFAAIAPALFDRIRPGLVHPYTKAGVDAGVASYESLTAAQILADVQACAAALRPLKVAISGFCTGGTWAWIAASECAFDAQVNFYGSHVPARLEYRPRCPSVMHYGDRDVIVPPADIERIRAAHPEVPIHVYPGGQHAFFNPDQPYHDAAHAALALERSVAFLERTLHA